MGHGSEGAEPGGPGMGGGGPQPPFPRRQLPFLGFPGGSVVKKAPTSAGVAEDEGSIPGSGRSHGVRNGKPLHYSCLENSTETSLEGCSP